MRRRSVEAIVSYFESFASSTPKKYEPPAFLLYPDVSKTSITLDATAAALRKGVERVFEKVATAFSGLERIEEWERRRREEDYPAMQQASTPVAHLGHTRVIVESLTVPVTGSVLIRSSPFCGILIRVPECRKNVGEPKKTSGASQTWPHDQPAASAQPGKSHRGHSEVTVVVL